MKTLDWLSPGEAGQKALGREITYELAYLKVYGYKCYALLKGVKGIYKSKKLSKLALRAFIGFLINYDSANIYRV